MESWTKTCPCPFVAVLPCLLVPTSPLGLHTNPPGGFILARRTRRGLEVLQGLAHPAGAGGLQRRVLASKGCKRRVQAAGSPQMFPRRLADLPGVPEFSGFQAWVPRFLWVFRFLQMGFLGLPQIVG